MSSKKKNPGLSRSSDATDDHEYAGGLDVDPTGKTKRKDPFSPAKITPTAKRQITESDGNEGLNAVLVAIKQLTDKVDSLSTQLQHNSIMLSSRIQRGRNQRLQNAVTIDCSRCNGC